MITMSSHPKIGEEPLPNWGRLMNAPESGYGVLLWFVFSVFCGFLKLCKYKWYVICSVFKFVCVSVV